MVENKVFLFLFWYFECEIEDLIAVFFVNVPLTIINFNPLTPRSNL